MICLPAGEGRSTEVSNAARRSRHADFRYPKEATTGGARVD